MSQPKNTSWQKVSKWYSQSVGSSGHYYHQHVVIPNSLRLLNLKSDSSLLDIACGEGVLGRAVSSNLEYSGFDIAPSLIKFAKDKDRSPKHHYAIADVQKTLPLGKTDFSHAAILLALQNIEHPDLVIGNAARYLSKNGQLLLVINHPMFRIPRQTSWEIDPGNKLQYRRVNRYLSPLKIPINAQPSRGETSPVTWSFHHPLQDYVKYLKEAGFVITNLEEWVSDKASEGRAAKMENLSRSEFPLFMTILAQKQSI